MNSFIRSLLAPVLAGLAFAALFLVINPREQVVRHEVVLTEQQVPAPETGNETPFSIPGPVSYADAVAKAQPAVVNIYSTKIVTQNVHPLLADPNIRRFFGLNEAPRRQRMESSLGSGVIVSPSGYVLTNNHVIAGADEIRVALSDGRETLATVVGTDPETDLALLFIEMPDLPAVTLAKSDAVRVGDVVLAIGNPFGVGQTVTSGIVSALARTTVGVADYQFFIQTDAAINPGNSGGALIDMQGRLVGVPSAIYSKTGGSLGIGFAIPATMVRSILHSHISGGRVVRPWLGAGGQDVTADIADSLGLERPVGVLITDVHPESMAAQAGIKVGDIITKLGSHTIPDGQTLRFRIATGTLGEVVPITILRDGQAQTLHITLLPPPENVPREETALKGDHPLSGATIANLSPVIADELSLDAVSGVVILAVERGSTAARLGLSEGDIIANINNQRMESVQEVGSAVAKPQREWVLKIKRGPQVLTLTLRL
ncbi:MAG: Do family serine endopeptidase [Rickettsiales bacterium]|nr:Do family serine endopeptidase [Rickettsiales bacterium]